MVLYALMAVCMRRLMSMWLGADVASALLPTSQSPATSFPPPPHPPHPPPPPPPPPKQPL